MPRGRVAKPNPRSSPPKPSRPARKPTTKRTTKKLPVRPKARPVSKKLQRERAARATARAQSKKNIARRKPTALARALEVATNARLRIKDARYLWGKVSLSTTRTVELAERALAYSDAAKVRKGPAREKAVKAAERAYAQVLAWFDQVQGELRATSTSYQPPVGPDWSPIQGLTLTTGKERVERDQRFGSGPVLSYFEARPGVVGVSRWGVSVGHTPPPRGTWEENTSDENRSRAAAIVADLKMTTQEREAFYHLLEVADEQDVWFEALIDENAYEDN